MNITNINSNMFFDLGGGALLMPIINAQIRKVVQSGGGDASAELKHFISGTAPATINLTEDYFEGRIRHFYNREFASNLSIKSVCIPASAPQMNAGYIFENVSNLENIVIKNKTTANIISCFQGCSSLKSCVFDGDNASIPMYCFSGCTALESITIKKTTGIMSLANTSDVFANCPSTFKVYVPANLVDSYKSATNWVNFADHIEAIVE